MRHILYTITALLLACFPVLANNTVDEADAAYMNDDFHKAIELYEKAIAEDGSSSQIYYNLGNAYYRNGNLGKAILNYERALKIDPTNSDAKTNLDFVNSKIADKPVDDQSLIEKLADKVILSASANSWAWLTAGLFAIFIGLLAGYIFFSSVLLRKTCFFGGIVFLVASIAGIIISFSAAARMSSSNDAIVLSESVQLGTSPRVPRNKAEEAFLLHEGTKLNIIDSLTTVTDTVKSKWYEVKVDNQHRAWIKSTEIEKI